MELTAGGFCLKIMKQLFCVSRLVANTLPTRLLNYFGKLPTMSKSAEMISVELHANINLIRKLFTHRVPRKISSINTLQRMKLRLKVKCE